MKKCKNCGANLKDTANFCEVCGRKQVAAEYTDSQNSCKKQNGNVYVMIGAVVLTLLAGSLFGNRLKAQKEPETAMHAVVQETELHTQTPSESTETPASVIPEVTEESATESAQTERETAETDYPVPQDPLTSFVEYCDKAYLTMEDIAGFDEWTCVLARNACYAKSGRIFQNYRLREYFGQFNWYNPTISPEQFSDRMLNDYQLANIGLVMEYEQIFK